ncbi:DUF58 domain-containing protein [Actinoallomurus iriomotensis]|uniref:DUF58 domain-containing protein n=1 Tax=Actinoallomurus iriomotensis TaxID=478107 RepID=A0A9W6S3U1_9ACTN|nr:DUF58 domain-containing protein [Actinoallomurus iriomotensis]GLY86579.1 hypothetical protein Airi02_045080 [Actinoallomurus iriomotensis]
MNGPADGAAPRRWPVTGTGIGLAVLAAVSYALGAALAYPVLVALAIGSAAVLVAAGCFVTVRPSVRLTRQVTPDRVTVGEHALGRLHVRNTGRRPSVAFTAVDRVGPETIALDVRAVAAGGMRAVNYPLPAPRRGRIPLGPLTVERRDPFGLFRWARRQTGDDVLWVHPRIHPMRPLPVGIVLDYEGRTHENARLGTVTFSALREYVPGDDPRQIHWRSTARLGTLVVREHIDTTEPTTTVVLDTRADAFETDSAFEDAVEVAASVVHTVEDLGRPVELHVIGASGDGPVLDRLSLAEPDPDADVALLLRAVDRGPAGGALVVVTGTTESGLLTRLAEQRRRFRPVVVISLAGDAAPPDGGLRRRPGMAVLTARSAAEAAVAWNRMVSGDAG